MANSKPTPVHMCRNHWDWRDTEVFFGVFRFAKLPDPTWGCNSWEARKAQFSFLLAGGTLFPFASLVLYGEKVEHSSCLSQHALTLFSCKPLWQGSLLWTRSVETILLHLVCRAEAGVTIFRRGASRAFIQIWEKGIKCTPAEVKHAGCWSETFEYFSTTIACCVEYNMTKIACVRRTVSVVQLKIINKSPRPI